MPRLDKLHRLANREKWGTQDRGPRVFYDYQQKAVRSMEDPNT